MKKILDKRKMSDSWQDYRKKQSGIGGSEVASILGVQPDYMKSAFILWLEKTGQKEPDEVDNEFVLWGNLLEPVIRKQFAEETGFKVYQSHYVLQHDKYEFMVANLDGEIKDPNRKGRGVLEIKTTSEWNHKDWKGDHVPLAYMAQVQHYLAVTGYDYAYIVVLIGGNKMRYWLIERDEVLINIIIQKEQEFMHMVHNDIAPEIGGKESESEWLAATYPQAIDEVMSIPPTIEQLALEYNELQEQQKEATARMKEIKNKIKKEGKATQMLQGNKVKVYMPTVTKTLLDTKRLAEEQPEIMAQYKTKISSYRDFKILPLEA